MRRNPPVESSPRLFSGLAALALLVVLAACRDDRVATYSAPKDPEPARHAHAAMPGMDAQPPPGPAGDSAGAAAPQIRWTAPARWRTAPPASAAAASVRAGSFTIVASGDAARTADMAITTFPGDVGGDLANVNRWRGQLQLPPISAAQLPAAITTLALPAGEFLLIDIAGENTPSPKRTLGAWLKQPAQNRTWFFKLTGDADLVASERDAFLAFLKTIVFDS